MNTQVLLSVVSAIRELIYAVQVWRAEAQRTGEWTEEEEEAFDRLMEQAFESEVWRPKQEDKEG